jgi:drug/metabolite transporter (DMT)-like permease
MAGKQRASLDRGPTGADVPIRAAREPRAFVAGSWLLVLCVLACGVFAGLAGKEVGDKDTMFVIAFIFLGVVTIGIFALAWVDASTRQDHGWEHRH